MERSNVTAVVFSAAKVELLEYTATTPEFALVTVFGASAALDPAVFHATILPSLFNAAKVLYTEYTATTPEVKLELADPVVPPY